MFLAAISLNHMKVDRCLIFVSIVLVLVSSCAREAQSTGEADIRIVLGNQEKAWNEGNIDEFMRGYWQSDSLHFVGTKITRGWQATLDRYKASYPDRAAMGALRFEFYRFAFLDPSSCLVTGRYTLTREGDQPTGLFTLLLKKLDGKWVIVYDHTS
jgi:hypothetical protein